MQHATPANSYSNRLGCDDESAQTADGAMFLTNVSEGDDAAAADLRGWSPIYSDSAPSARGYSTAVVHARHHVYTFGGSAGSSRKNDMWVHKNDAWTQVETNGDVPSPRNSHSAVVWRDSIIVFGGWDGSRNCNDLYFFDIPTSSWRHVVFAFVLSRTLASLELCLFDTRTFSFR
jgi:hypothetical protein